MAQGPKIVQKSRPWDLSRPAQIDCNQWWPEQHHASIYIFVLEGTWKITPLDLSLDCFFLIHFLGLFNEKPKEHPNNHGLKRWLDHGFTCFWHQLLKGDIWKMTPRVGMLQTWGRTRAVQENFIHWSINICNIECSTDFKGDPRSTWPWTCHNTSQLRAFEVENSLTRRVFGQDNVRYFKLQVSQYGPQPFAYSFITSCLDSEPIDFHGEQLEFRQEAVWASTVGASVQKLKKQNNPWNFEHPKSQDLCFSALVTLDVSNIQDQCNAWSLTTFFLWKRSMVLASNRWLNFIEKKRRKHSGDRGRTIGSLIDVHAFDRFFCLKHSTCLSLIGPVYETKGLAMKVCVYTEVYGISPCYLFHCRYELLRDLSYFLGRPLFPLIPKWN